MDQTTTDELTTFVEETRAAMRAGDASATGRLEDRYAEVREALDRLSADGRADEAFRLAAALTQFWMGSKRVDEGMAWLAAALGSGAGGDGARARAFHDHGYLAFFSGRYDEAERSFVQSAALADRAGDRDVKALALAGSARVALNDDAARAVRLTREAMTITEDLPDSIGRSSASHVLGVALQLTGDLAGAREVMTARIDHARANGNDFVVFVESANLGMVERKLGNLDRAEALSREALRIVVRIGDQMAIPWVINGLAAVIAAAGRYERAGTLLAIAESLLARAGGEWPADEREQYESTLDAVAGAVAADTLRDAREQAAAMSLDEAVTEALA